MPRKQKKKKEESGGIFGLFNEVRAYTLRGLAELVLVALGVGVALVKISEYAGYMVFSAMLFLVFYKAIVAYQNYEARRAKK